MNTTTTALREHAEILLMFTAWTEDHLRVLGDLGYEGEADTITIAFKKPKGGGLSDPHKTYNKFRNGIRAIGERGNSLLKMTFKALRNVSLCAWTIGRIVAAALGASAHRPRSHRVITRRGQLRPRRGLLM